MPTLNILNPFNPNPIAREDIVQKVGLNYANLLTLGNESSDTDGFLVTGVLNGKLFVNTGTTLVPVYKQLVSTVTDPSTQIEVPFTTTARGGSSSGLSLHTSSCKARHLPSSGGSFVKRLLLTLN